MPALCASRAGFFAACLALFGLSACSREAPGSQGGPSATVSDASGRDQGHDHDHDHDHDDTNGPAPGAHHEQERAREAGSAPTAGPTDARGDTHDRGHAEEVHLTREAVVRHGVTIATAERRVLPRTLTAPGQVAFNRSRMAHVGTPVAGRVVALLAELGEEVVAGDPLVRIESPELVEAQGMVLARRAERLAAEPLVESTRVAFERGRLLAETSQGVSTADVEKRESEWRAARSASEAARSAESVAIERLVTLGLSREAVDEVVKTGQVRAVLELAAPLPGQVVVRDVTLGERVDPERDALIVVADLEHLWILADVPASRLGEVAVGARARVWAGTNAEHGCEGAVTYLSPSVDPRTRSFVARIEAADRHPELRPGVFVRVDLELGGVDESAPSIVVPEGAVVRLEGRSCVFVPVTGEPETFVPRTVTVGAASRGFVPVVSGLAEGEPYVATGAFLLKADAGKSHATHDH